MAIKLNKQQQQMVALAVLGIGGFGYVYYSYLWAPASARIQAAKASIEDIEQKIRTAESQAARRDKIVKELEILNQKASEAERRLPKTKDLPAVIDTLNKLAKKYKITLSAFAPGGSTAKQYFTEVPYTVSLSGTYHDVGRFLAAIAVEERIFNVRNVTFTGARSEGVGNPVLSVSMQLISYQYKG